MSLSFQITVETGVAEALSIELRQMASVRLESLRADSETFIRQAFHTALLNSPTFEALSGGRLREELGLEDGEGSALSVVNAIVAAVDVSVLPPRGDELGTIDISIIRGRFEAALAAPGASYLSHSRTRGTSLVIPWLDWLLFAGGERVTMAELLLEYPNRKVSYRTGSRTGKALMVYRDYTRVTPSGKRNHGLGRSNSGWRVPAEHAGVESDNWVTRAANQTIPLLEQYLSRRLQSFWGVQ